MRTRLIWPASIADRATFLTPIRFDSFVVHRLMLNEQLDELVAKPLDSLPMHDPSVSSLSLELKEPSLKLLPLRESIWRVFWRSLLHVHELRINEALLTQ